MLKAKKFAKKLDIENLSGMHFEIWLTNEQVYDTDESNENFNDSNKIELAPGTNLDFINNSRHAKMIRRLFKPYKKDDGTYNAAELSNAQLYMHIQADDDSFKRIWNI